MSRKTTWIVIANKLKALAVSVSVNGRYTVELEWRNEIDASHDDQPGMTHNRIGASQHRLAPHNPEDTISTDFARQIGKDLERRHASKAFDKLILTAAPHMLGALRAELPKSLRDSVSVELDRDLTAIPLDALSDHLPEVANAGSG